MIDRALAYSLNSASVPGIARLVGFRRYVSGVDVDGVLERLPCDRCDAGEKLGWITKGWPRFSVDTTQPIVLETEKASGQSLESLMIGDRRMTTDQLKTVFANIVFVLSKLEAGGVMHNDLHPGNVFVDAARSYRVTLIDWDKGCKPPDVMNSDLDEKARHGGGLCRAVGMCNRVVPGLDMMVIAWHMHARCGWKPFRKQLRARLRHRFAPLGGGAEVDFFRSKLPPGESSPLSHPGHPCFVSNERRGGCWYPEEGFTRPSEALADLRDYVTMIEEDEPSPGCRLM